MPPSSPDPAELHRIVVEAATTLEPELDDLATRVADQAHSEMPELGDHARVTARTVAAVRANVAGFLTFVRADAPAESVQVSDDTVNYAQAFVHRGIALPTAMRAFRLAHAQMWKAWSAAIDSLELPPELHAAAHAHVSDAMFRYVDRVTTGLVEEYELERERWNRSVDSRRAETVAAILDDTPVDIDSASRTLGYDLRRWHTAVVLWAPEENDGSLIELQREAVEISERLTGSPRPLILPSRGSTLWAWSGAVERPDDFALDDIVIQPRARPIRIALGETASGIDGFRWTHEAAMHTRRVMRLSAREPVAQRFRSISLTSLLTADEQQMRRFVADELGALAADDDATLRLRATLVVYFEERSSAAKTGRRLSIHTNSVHYRIRRCSELIGHPVHERRNELETALRLKQSLGGEALDTP